MVHEEGHSKPAEGVYVPHDVLDETTKTAIVGLGSGFFIAAIQNALSRRNVGAMGVFTRGAPVIGVCGTQLACHGCSANARVLKACSAWGV